MKKFWKKYLNSIKSALFISLYIMMQLQEKNLINEYPSKKLKLYRGRFELYLLSLAKIDWARVWNLKGFLWYGWNYQ